MVTITLSDSVTGKQGIQQFHKKFVLAPADKASNNYIVVLRLYYINTLKSELSTAKTFELISTDKKSAVDKHCNEIANKFAVGITEPLCETNTYCFVY